MAIDVGPARFVDAYETVTLSGLNIASWAQISGSPTVSLSGSGDSRTFTAPALVSGTTLAFEATTSSAASIVNGTFETDLTGWSGFNASTLRDTAHAHGGTYALKTSPTGTTGDVGITVLGAQPSSSYTVTMWVYCETTPGRALVIYGTSSTSGGVKTAHNGASFTPSTGSWSQRTHTFTTTSTMATLRIGLIVSGSTWPISSTVWIDDVSISGPGAAPETATVEVNVRPWSEWTRNADNTWHAARTIRRP